MHFPKFWAKGNDQGFVAWQWSDVSLSDAAGKARAAAQQLRQRFESHAREDLSPGGWYYSSKPLREEVLEEFRDAHGDVYAAISRNAYGALILNTCRIAFLDIDINSPQDSASRGGIIAALMRSILGTKQRPVKESPPQERKSIDSWFRMNPSCGGRLYETFAGYRILLTNKLYDPEGGEIGRIFDSLGCDPLYRKLCSGQKSFRARLTPKPWRCDCVAPPDRWPRDPAQLARFQQWERSYSRVCEDFATCRFLADFGNPAEAPEIKHAVELHDTVTKAHSGRQLA